ncbi:MAG: PorV/PorQ family protein [bacterium]
MTKKLIWIIILLQLLSSVLFSSGYKRPGSTSAQFLKIGISARAIGMGEAYTAVAEGADAFFYNPAGLARTPSVDIYASHSTWFAGLNYESFGIAKNFGSKGAIGLSFSTLRSDEMLVRTPLKPDGTGETFNYGNYRVGLSCAKFLTDHAALGLSINYLNLNMWTYTVQSFSADLGVTFLTDFYGFRFGMSIVNFGPDIKFIKEEYSIPINFSFGAAFEPIKNDEHVLTVSLSTIKATDAEQKLRMGTEYLFNNIFALRGGYKFDLDAESWSLGAGIKTEISNVKFRVDYAYSDFSILGNRNLFTIGLAF